MGRPKLSSTQVRSGQPIVFIPDNDLADALNAFMVSNEYTVSEGMRFLCKAALSVNATSIAPEIARNKAYRDTEMWVRERVAANFREISQLLEQQNRELRLLEKPPE